MFEKSSTLDHPIIPLYPHFVGDDIFLSHSTIIEWLNPNFCVFQSHFLMVSLLSAGDIGIIDPIVKCHSLPWKFMNTHQQIQMNSVKLSHPIQSHEKSPFKSQPPLNPIEIPLKSPWNHFISSPWNHMKSPWNHIKTQQIPISKLNRQVFTQKARDREVVTFGHGRKRCTGELPGRPRGSSLMRQKWWNDGGRMVILMVFHHITPSLHHYSKWHHWRF